MLGGHRDERRLVLVPGGDVLVAVHRVVATMQIHKLPAAPTFGQIFELAPTDALGTAIGVVKDPIGRVVIYVVRVLGSAGLGARVGGAVRIAAGLRAVLGVRAGHALIPPLVVLGVGGPSAPVLSVRRLHLLRRELEQSDADDRNNDRDDELPPDRLVTEPGEQYGRRDEGYGDGAPDDHPIPLG